MQFQKIYQKDIKKDTQKKLYNACAIRALSSILDNNVDI
jgi:hypothetical protein